MDDRDKIDPTDEMVSAGVRAYEIWDSRDPPNYVVWDIWVAMERVRRITATATPAGMVEPCAQNARDEK